MIDQQKQMADAEKIVKAGMRILYNKSTRQMLRESVDSSQPAAVALANSVVGVMKLLWDKANKSLPPAAIGPATAMLVYELAEFMRQAGKQVSSADIKTAIDKAMALLKAVFASEFGGQKVPPLETAAAPPAMPAGGLIAQGT